MADAIPLSPLDPHEDEEEEESHIFPNLPDDVGLQCLARLPRSCYRPLSRVCKLWQSQFRSQTLYSTRKALKVVDFSLCLYMRIPGNHEKLSKWYEMFPGSNSSTDAASSLFKIPSLPQYAQPVLKPYVVSVGAKIYVIGGAVGRGRTPSRRVWVYDVVSSDQWKLVESQMAVARLSATGAVVNNKIYVADRRWLPNWAEVFDTETEAWSPLPNPDLDELGLLDQVDKLTWWTCAALDDGKIIYSGEWRQLQATLEFDPSSGKWRQLQAYLGWALDSMTVVDGVFYRFIDGEIMGYDFDGNEWKEVLVLRGGVMDNDVLLSEPIDVPRMVNMNGKLVILWQEWCTVGTTEMLKFHAAVIDVSRKDDDMDAKFWGSILWRGIVGEAPLGTKIVDCIAVGL